MKKSRSSETGSLPSVPRRTSSANDKPHLKTIFVDGSGRVTTDTYDDHDRLVQRTDALGRSEYYSYDEGGNLQSHTDGNGRTTFYHYDSRGRLTRVRDPLTHESVFEYDGQGDLVKVTGPAGPHSGCPWRHHALRIRR